MSEPTGYSLYCDITAQADIVITKINGNQESDEPLITSETQTSQ